MIDPVAAQEKFIKKVNKTLENVEEVEIEEDWEFLTEDEMRDANWPREPCFKQFGGGPLCFRCVCLLILRERIVGVKTHCEGKKGFKRT